MEMDDFFNELELELEVLLTMVKKPENRYLNIGGNRYSPGFIVSLIKLMIASTAYHKSAKQINDGIGNVCKTDM